VPERVKLSFVIFDIWALLTLRLNPVWHTIIIAVHI